MNISRITFAVSSLVLIALANDAHFLARLPAAPRPSNQTILAQRTTFVGKIKAVGDDANSVVELEA